MNVADIKRRATNMLGDDAKLVFEDVDLLDYINDAQVDLCRKTDLLFGISTINVVSGTESYALPVDFIEVDRVTYKGLKLRKSTWQEVDLYDPDRDTVAGGVGDPEYYYRKGITIFLYPVPNSSTTGALKVYYSRTPTALTGDTDVPEIPLAMHEDLVLRVVAKGHEQVEDYQQSIAKMSEYDKAVALSQEQSQEGSDETYPMVRDSEIAIWSPSQ